MAKLKFYKAVRADVIKKFVKTFYSKHFNIFFISVSYSSPIL